MKIKKRVEQIDSFLISILSKILKNDEEWYFKVKSLKILQHFFIFLEKTTCKVKKNVLLYMGIWMNTTYNLSYTPYIS